VPKPLVGYFSRRYISGSRLEDAVREVKRLNSMEMCATLDVLGEAIKDLEEARYSMEQYIKTLEAIEKEKLDANISVKPTHLGLMMDYDSCVENYSRLLEEATLRSNFVRIDMEDATTTTATLKLYSDLRKKFNNVGIVFQAYLRRTIADLVEMTKKVNNLNIRLCKGIYVEPRKIAWKDREIIRLNFQFLLEEAFKRGIYVGIATHDELLVWAGLKLIQQMNIPKDRYEFQMLLGVQPVLRRIIVEAGHKLRVYVPYGEQWYAYSTRRLRENPQIAGHIIRTIFTKPER
jgi:proline dehydrogenase